MYRVLLLFRLSAFLALVEAKLMGGGLVAGAAAMVQDRTPRGWKGATEWYCIAGDHGAGSGSRGERVR